MSVGLSRSELWKTVDWIWMLFGWLEESVERWEGAFLGVNVGYPIVTNGDCGIVILCREGWRCISSQINLGFLVKLLAYWLV